MANFCMSCGVPVEPKAKFCVVCGQELEQEQEQPQLQHIVNPEAQPVEYHDEHQQPPVQHGVYTEPRPVEYPLNQPQFGPQYQPQPQQYQPQFGPQYQPQQIGPQQIWPQAAAKKKRKLPIILLVIGGSVVLIIVIALLLVSVASGKLKNMAKASFYEIGSDEVPSIKLALGEQRDIAGLSTSTRNGTQTKEITFVVDGDEQNEDMLAYMDYLREDDFLLLTDVDFSGPEGEGTLGRNSVDEGYCIIVELEYDDTGYIITLIREKGEIEANDEQDIDIGGAAGPGPKIDPDPGAEVGADPISDPVDDSADAPTDAPTDDPGPNPAVAAMSAIEIFDSGCFHMIGTFEVEGQGTIEMETYRKGDKAALITRFGDTSSKMIIKDGKVYYVMDEMKTVFIDTSNSPEDMMPEYGAATMSYIGEGTGEFNGKTYPCSEYAENDGGRSFYFMDGSTLKGIRVILADNSIFEMTIITLDTNVPDDVFSWPSNYEVEGLPS